jgi:hypothetical protein
MEEPNDVPAASTDAVVTTDNWSSNILKTMLTRDDNATSDLTLVGTALGLVALIVLQGYVTYLSGTFDTIQFALGYTTILFGSSTSVALRILSEQKAALKAK